jgi:hypothetical protein
MLSKDQTIFILKVNLQADLKKNGHQGKELLLSEEKIILSLKVILTKERYMNGLQEKEQML